ncbi:MAG: 2-amino-4-hydroxy-6-hydroxymethyldihydropteridine diphosphokinase [Pseudomonadota bacterium]
MSNATERNSAFVALGANLSGIHGDPRSALEAAIKELAALSSEPVEVSPFYKSDPKDCPPGSPVYINAVVKLVPMYDETPLSLLKKLQRIEGDFGRVRSGVRNEARTLDLDLLEFGDEQLETDVLVLPHPRAHERRFVLEPWITLAGVEWPLKGSTLGAWLDRCSDPPLLKIDSAND